MGTLVCHSNAMSFTLEVTICAFWMKYISNPMAVETQNYYSIVVVPMKQLHDTRVLVSTMNYDYKWTACHLLPVCFRLNCSENSLLP